VLRWRLLLFGARERTVDVFGLPIRYFETGPADGEALVLVHGLGDSAESWARIVPLLGRDHRILVPDLAGFGRVPIPLTSTTDWHASKNQEKKLNVH